MEASMTHKEMPLKVINNTIHNVYLFKFETNPNQNWKFNKLINIKNKQLVNK
jgi:hypothetical protein